MMIKVNVLSHIHPNNKQMSWCQGYRVVSQCDDVVVVVILFLGKQVLDKAVTPGISIRANYCFFFGTFFDIEADVFHIIKIVDWIYTALL